MGQFATAAARKVPGLNVYDPGPGAKGQPFNVLRLVEEFTKIMEEKIMSDQTFYSLKILKVTSTLRWCPGCGDHAFTELTSQSNGRTEYYP